MRVEETEHGKQNQPSPVDDDDAAARGRPPDASATYYRHSHGPAGAASPKHTRVYLRGVGVRNDYNIIIIIIVVSRA